MKSVATLATCFVFLASGVTLAVDIPDPDLSYATTNCPFGHTCVVYNDLEGLGNRFDQARLSNGQIVDARIRVFLVNHVGVPIVGLPAEDMWLETSTDGLAYHPGGTIADGPSDANGVGQWLEPLAAGGCSIGETTHVMALATYIGP
jgi:hypothetical protein